LALWSAFFNKLIKNKQRKPNGMKNGAVRSGRADDLEKKYLDKRLEANIQTIKETTGNSSDIIIRVLEAGKGSHFPIQAAVVMADGLTDYATVSDFIIESLLNEQLFEDIPKEKVLTVLEKKIYLTPSCRGRRSSWSTERIRRLGRAPEGARRGM